MIKVKLPLFALVTTMLVGGAFLHQQDLLYNPAFTGFMNVMHFPAGLIFALMLGWLGSGRSISWLSVVLALSAVLFGLIELLQPYVGRSASLGDFANSLAGSGLGVLALLAARRRWRLLFLTTGVSALVIVTLQGWYLLKGLQDYSARQECWPVLEDFERKDVLAGWSTGTSASVRRIRYPSRFAETFPDNKFFGVLGPTDEDTASIHMAHAPVRTDWSDFDLLCLELKAEPAAALVLRIDDRMQPDYKDRFTLTLPVTRSWERRCIALADLRTPEGRPLDTRQVRQLILTSAGAPPAAVSLDNLLLIPSGEKFLPAARCQGQLN